MQDALLVTASFRGHVIAAKLLRASARGPASSFHVGWAAGVDAPVARAVAPAGKHALVRPGRDGWLVDATTSMSASGGVALPTSIACGDVTIALEPVAQPPALPRRPLDVDRRALFALLATILVAGWLAWLPPDPATLAWDDLAASPREIVFRRIPAQLPPPAPTARRSGAAGSIAISREGARPVKTPHSTPARRSARATAERGPHGIVALLGRWRSSDALGALFAPDRLTIDANAALDGLDAGGDHAFSGGAFGSVGTGDHGAGAGERTIGEASLGTIGGCRGRCEGGRGVPGVDEVAKLGPRTSHPPTVVPSTPHVAGVMDKEIIRRVVRQHLNEVRGCYDRELPRSPALAGRLVVKFVIAPNGSVAGAIAESSTLANARVEACVTAAVARWTFPTARDAGTAIVSYPFVFAVAGGG